MTTRDLLPQQNGILVKVKRPILYLFSGTSKAALHN